MLRTGVPHAGDGKILYSHVCLSLKLSVSLRSFYKKTPKFRLRTIDSGRLGNFFFEGKEKI